MAWTKILLEGDALTYGAFMVKPPVRVASTANIVLATGTLLTIDGVVTVAGDRVLAKDQTAGAENGIYAAATGAWSRTTDADVSAEVKAGLTVAVEEGTVGADTSWILTTNNPITLGTTALVFSFVGGVPGTAGTIQPDATAAEGTANTIARSDHTHAIVAAAAGSITPDATAAEGTATSFARSDHAHGITCAIPVAVGITLAEGTGTSFARDDHVHELGTGSIDTAAQFAADVVGAAAISDTATDITFKQIILTPSVTGTGTTEGTLMYDSDDNHLYVYVI